MKTIRRGIGLPRVGPDLRAGRDRGWHCTHRISLPGSQALPGSEGVPPGESNAGRRLALLRAGVASLVVFASVVVSGCGNMKDQRYARTESPTGLRAQGTSAHAPPPHAVPHDPDAAVQAKAFLSVANGGIALPVPLTAELLQRGRERFGIYCAVCHGDDGYGQGIIVRRGFPAPPSLHEPRLREASPAYVVQVITHGHGVMYSYADRVAMNDRWAIAAYVRALQLSQHALASQLSEDDRKRLGQL